MATRLVHGGPGQTYESLRAAFEWQIPERLNLARACADDQAAGHRAVVSVDDGGQATEVTFGQLTSMSASLAGGLRAIGVEPHDRVGVVVPQSLETGLVHLAIWRLGAVSLPLAALFGPTVGSGFIDPIGVAVDFSGHVFVADTINGDIKEVFHDGNINTLASGLNEPLYLAVDPNGNIFVTGFDNTIKEVLPNLTVNTINLGTFLAPRGIAVDTAGDVFVAFQGDIHGGGIVELSPLSVAATPSPISSSSGNTGVSATVSNLTPSTTYYVRLVGVNVGGTVADSSVQSVTTLLALPSWFNLTTGLATWDGTSLSMNGTALIIGDPLQATDHPDINIAAGTLTVNLQAATNLVHLDGLIVDNGASFILKQTTGTHTNLVIAGTSAFVLASPTNDIDLTNNSMVITGAGTQTFFFGQDIASGKIFSSTITANQTAGNFQTGIGTIQNATAANSPIYTTFNGQSVTTSDALLRYTYLGDADLNGTVNAADYIQIDNGFNSQSAQFPTAGWYNGDFNYDGATNGDDYTLIDNAFNTQTGISVAAVPAIPLATDAAIASSNQPALAVNRTTNSTPDDQSDMKKRHRTELDLLDGNAAT